MIRNMTEFDLEHSEALRGLWFCGDVHSEFKHLAQSLLAAEKKPSWLVFLGDIDIDHVSFREVLAPLRRHFSQTQVAFIHGNHDADTYDHWQCLHDCGDALAMHGKVVELDGIRVAGLGGNFMGRIWSPPGSVLYQSRDAALNDPHNNWRDPDGQRPNAQHLATIYPEDILTMSQLRADILVTHEAPSCHPYGYDTLDGLARDMQVVRSFHGHHHDDRSDEYAKVRETLGFDARGVNYCSIKNGLGEHVFEGPKGW